MLFPDVIGLGRMWRACYVCPPEHPGGCGYCDSGRVVYGYRAGVVVDGTPRLLATGATYEEACERAADAAIRSGLVSDLAYSAEVADA